MESRLRLSVTTRVDASDELRFITEGVLHGNMDHGMIYYAEPDAAGVERSSDAEEFFPSRVCILWDAEGIRILREGVFTTSIELRRGREEWREFIYHTPFGDLAMEVAWVDDLQEWDDHSVCFELVYQLRMNDALAQQMRIRLEGLFL